MELAFSRSMALFNGFLSLTLFMVFSVPALSDAAAATSCTEFYVEFLPVTAKLEARARGLIEEYKILFLAPESRIQRIQYSQMKKSMDHFREALRKINKNAYPFVYMREGYAQEIRLWAKTNQSEAVQGVESMLKRYKDLPMSRRLLIERTAFIRTEFEYLNSLLKLPETIFPLTVEIPQAYNKGLLTEKRVLNSKVDVVREIAVLKANEPDRFDEGTSRKFSNGAFFQGREREQAQLEQILTIAYRELKKFPLALRDSKKRMDLISQLERALADVELQASSEARYIEARRQFKAEVSYFTGNREFEQAGDDANDKLWLNDRTDLGIDSETLGPVSKFGRLVVVTLPLQGIGALMALMWPHMQQEFKEVVFHEAYMQEIAKQDAGKFEDSALAYLKKHDGATFNNGQWVLNVKAQADLAHLRKLHQEFKDDAQKERESVASFKKLLAGDEPAHK
jgi:hypothetical protein